MKLNKNSPGSGYAFFYERKIGQESTQNNQKIVSHFALQTPMSPQPMKIFDLKTDFIRTNDLSNATLHSKVDFVILTRTPPVSETIEVDYVRRSVRTANQAGRLISPEGNLKVQLKTKSGVFNFLLDHQHRRSLNASKKGLIH